MNYRRKNNIDEAEANLKSAIEAMPNQTGPDRFVALTKAVQEYSAAVFELASYSKVLALETTAAITKNVEKDRASSAAADSEPIVSALYSLVKASRDGDLDGAKIAHEMLDDISKRHGTSLVNVTDKNNII